MMFRLVRSVPSLLTHIISLSYCSVVKRANVGERTERGVRSLSYVPFTYPRSFVHYVRFTSLGYYGGENASERIHNNKVNEGVGT